MRNKMNNCINTCCLLEGRDIQVMEAKIVYIYIEYIMDRAGMEGDGEEIT